MQILYKGPQHETKQVFVRMLALALLALVRGQKNCSNTKQPWWLPGRVVAHDQSGLLYGQTDLSVLCCDGKLGGLPRKTSVISHWKVYGEEQYAIVDDAQAKCAKKQDFPELATNFALESRAEPVCPSLHHFPSVPFGACSGAFNPTSKTLEFAKCCPSGKMGERGTARSTQFGVWVYLSEGECRRSTCRRFVKDECESAKHYAFVSTDGNTSCKGLPDLDKFTVETYKSCGWDDVQSRIGSSDSLPACLSECARFENCRSVEVFLHLESHLCIMRSETCIKRLYDTGVHSYIKKVPQHSRTAYNYSAHQTLFIIILSSIIVFSFLLMGYLYFN